MAYQTRVTSVKSAVECKVGLEDGHRVLIGQEW